MKQLQTEKINCAMWPVKMPKLCTCNGSSWATKLSASRLATAFLTDMPGIDYPEQKTGIWLFFRLSRRK